MTAERAPSGGSGLQIVTLVLGVSAFVLGVVGLSKALPPQHLADRVDLAYRALQLFVLDGAALEGKVFDTPAGFFWELQVARFLAPAVTVIALLLGVRSLLAERVRRGRIRRLRNHVVVCGGDDVALALARNLEAGKQRVVLVRETGPDAFPLLTVDGDPRRPATLLRAGIDKAEQVYACSPSSALNAAIALTAGTLRRPGRQRLETIAQVGSEDLVDALRVRRMATSATDGAGLDFFSLDDVAARALLRRHPLTADVPMVVGFGTLGQAVVRAIVRQPVTEGPTRALVVVTADPAAVADLADRVGAPKRRWDVRVGRESEQVGQVYVCLADEDLGLAAGLRLARAGDRRVVVCLRNGSPFREALDQKDGLRVFGLLDEACRATSIADGLVVIRTARAIHQGYVDDALDRGDTLSVNASMAAWEDLPDHLQDANRAQAEHVGEKLVELGAILTTRSPEPPFAFTEDEIERLARLEHQRWMDERLAAGFEYGERREERRSRWWAWLPRRIYPGRRFHPDLRDWPELSPESKEKDVDAIRRMPGLLAAEGLYIERPAQPPGPSSSDGTGR